MVATTAVSRTNYIHQTAGEYFASLTGHTNSPSCATPSGGHLTHLAPPAGTSTGR